MTEEISVGVKILLERFKTNPEELSADFGKWAQLREEVFDRKERGVCGRFTRGLSAHEIDLLHEAFSKCARQSFDSYVMQRVLDQDEKEEYVGQAALNKAMAKRGLLAQFPPPVKDPNYNPYQNTIQPGSWQNVASQTSSTSINLQGNTVVQGTFDAEPSPSFVQKIKRELGL